MANEFSPELALVDPELAGALRESLGVPEDCLDVTRPPEILALREAMVASPRVGIPVARAPVPAAASTAVASSVSRAPSLPPAARRTVRPSRARGTSQPPRRTTRRGWQRVGHSAIVLVLVGFVALPFLAFGSPDYSRLGPSSSAAPAGNDGDRAVARPAPPRTAPSLRTSVEHNSKPRRGGVSRSAGRETRSGEKGSSPSAASTSRRGRTQSRRSTRASVQRPRAAVEHSATRAHVVGWSEVRTADLYNVVFVNGKRRVDRWVKGTSITLQSTAPGSSKSTARPLAYRWYVYPLFREGKAYRFGKLVAHGSIRLPSSSLAQ